MAVKEYSAQDHEILDYDWSSLEKTVATHDANVALFQQTIQDEQVKKVIIMEIMKRKRQLEAEQQQAEKS